jgi:hypothetical protein
MKNLIALLFSSSLVVSIALLVGCKTGPSTQHLSKNTKVCVSVETKDILYAQTVVTESAVQGVAKKMQRHIVDYLTQHGIQSVTPDALTANDAKLVVNIDAIENEAIRDKKAFEPTFMRYQPIIRYSSHLTANGVTLLNYDHEQSNESLDKLTRELGERIGERVARWYK